MKRILPAFAAATLILAPLLRAQSAAATAPTSPATNTVAAPDASTSLDNPNTTAPAGPRAAHRAKRLARMHERMLKKYDKNGDGVLDASEQAAALADLETRPRFIARFDKDGDGKLNEVEKANAENTMRALWARQQSAASANSAAPAAPATTTAP